MNHRTFNIICLYLSLNIWPFFIPIFCFLLTWRFFLTLFSLPGMPNFLATPLHIASFNIAFHGFFACCMQHLLIYSFSHPHHLGLIASFTIMVCAPNLSSETDWVTILFLKSSLILSPIWNYEREFDILLISILHVFPHHRRRGTFQMQSWLQNIKGRIQNPVKINQREIKRAWISRTKKIISFKEWI